MFRSITSAILKLVKEVEELREDVRENTAALKEIVSELEETNEETNLALTFGDEIPQ